MSYRYDGFARVRVALELSDKVLVNLTDVNGDAARFPRGAKVRFEFGLFYNGEIVDASAIDAARLRILSSDDPDSALAMDSDAGIIRLKGGLTLTEWQAGDPASAHIVVEFTSNLTAEGAFTGTLADADVEHWFLLTAGVGADFIAAGKIKSFDGGYNPAAGTPPATVSGASLENIEALLNSRLANVVKFNGNPAGAKIEFTAPSTGLKGKIGIDDEGNFITPNQVST